MREPVLVVMLLLAAFALYGPSLSNDFVWDDKILIVHNPNIKEMSIDNLRTLLTKDLMYRVEKSNFYRPLQSLSYMVDYALWSEDPRGFRGMNIMIHALNAIVIFTLLRVLSRHTLASFLSALFFLVHPLHTEAVLWASARKDLLSTLFLLLSTIGYLHQR